MARGNGGARTYLDDADYQAFLRILSEVKARKPFRLYAYCLMPNHFHLLIEVEKFAISTIMHRLLTRYCKYFNIRRRRFGHVFQSRFKAILCDKDAYLLELLRYIHLNPVRARLVAGPELWPWSGFADYLADRPEALTDTAFPLSRFHENKDRARWLYRSFVDDGIGIGHQEDYYPPTSLPVLGNEVLQGEFLERTQGVRPRETPERKKTLLELGQELSAESGVPLETLAGGSRRRDIVSLKRRFVLSAIDHGIRPSDIAAFLHCTPSAVSQVLTLVGR
jgi:REP element-mobilizing transposase RayT